MTKAEISKNLRWKRPALMDLSYEQIQNKLWDISDACGDVHWAYDDDETLIDALDGNEDEAGRGRYKKPGQGSRSREKA